MNINLKSSLISCIISLITIFSYLILLIGPFSLIFVGGPLGEKIAKKTESLEIFGPYSIFIFSIVFFLIDLLGLIFGILGLKSPKKKLAILGIILSLIGLLIIIGFNLLVYVLGPHTF